MPSIASSKRPTSTNITGMPSMARSKRPISTPEDLEFENLKPFMEDLYVKQGVTRKRVSEIMEAQYGLKATKHRYEKAFRHWNWSKNIPSQFWDAVCLNLYHLKDYGNKFEVFNKGDRIEDERVQREMRRRPESFFRSRGARNVLPDGLVILARTNETTNLFFQLPFHAFGVCVMTSGHLDFGIWSNMDSSIGGFGSIIYPRATPLLPPSPNDTDISSASPVTTWFRTPGCVESLEAVTFPVLSYIQLSSTLTTGLGMHVEMTKHHWQMLLSISNNFAGLAGLDAPGFFEFLRNEMSRSVASMVRRASKCHTMQSLICNILRASIGMGDAKTVHFILNCANNVVNLDSLVCLHEGVPCTALEKAGSLLHVDVVRVLLHHGANIETTGFEPEPHKARSVLDFLAENQIRYFERPLQSDISSILVEAGCQCTGYSLKNLILISGGSIIQSLIKANKVVDLEKCFDQGCMHAALAVLDEDMCGDLINRMEFVGSDINTALEIRRSSHIELRRGGRGGVTLLDIAASRGFINVVKELLLKGATLSKFSLGDALSSKSEELVTFLLEHGARFEQQFAYYMADDEQISTIPLPRASEYNLPYEPLIIVDPLSDTDHKGHLLVKAIKEGRNEEVEYLIDSGARLDVVISDCEGPPLYEAIKKRNADLVCLLLDAGADPNFLGHEEPQAFPERIPTMMLAVQWGDCIVIQRLIDAGAIVHSLWFPEEISVHPVERRYRGHALHIAVQKSDKRLVDLLLRSGSEINTSVWRPVIQAAAESNNVEIMRLLLSSGGQVASDLADVYDDKISDTHYLLLFTSSQCTLDSAQEAEDLLDTEQLAGVNLFDRTSGIVPRHHPGTPEEEKIASFFTAAEEQAEDSFFRDLFKSLKNSFMDYYEWQLDLSECDPELISLVLDAHQSRCPRFYQSQVLLNMQELIWSVDYDRFTDLISRRFSIDTFCTSSWQFATMYHDAIVRAKKGEPFFVEKLFEHGCDPQSLLDFDHKTRPCMIAKPYVTAKPHVTAFHLAIASGSTDVVKLFVEHGANVNLPPRLSVTRTPLQHAAACGHLNVARFLITLGAHVNAPAARFRGATALQLAAIGGHHAIIDLLISYGADVDALAAKLDGRTALEGAAEHGRLDTVKVLLNAGAADGGKDRAQMKSAIKYADENGHLYISDMLKEYLEYGEIRFDITNVSPEPFDDMFDWNRWDENAISIE